jgi:pSer/pThr/pTyr-binding forkhead associated (FHA) protein
MPVRFRILASTAAASGVPAAPSVERVVDVADGHVEIRLGRRADLELPLPFGTLSSIHARVVRAGQSHWIEDAGSTNGTSVDGLRLDPGERRAVEPGAELRLADVRLRFEGHVAFEQTPVRRVAPEGVVEGTATIARRLVDDLLGQAPASHPTLVVTRGAPARRLPLVDLDRPYVVGRSESCALPLDLDEVSREHAAFVRDAAGVLVRDLGSKNGVLVGGVRIATEHRPQDGDAIQIGPVTLTLEDPVARYLQELATAPDPSPLPSEPAAPSPDPAPLVPKRPRASLPLMSVAVSLNVVAAAIAATVAILL